MSVQSRFSTHEVLNQPLPLPAYNAWRTDAPLREAVQRHGGGWAQAQLDAHGELVGGELMELGELANRHRPILHLFDRHGRRIDDVEFHPAYHAVMRHAMAAGVHAFSWQHEDRPGALVARSALMYLDSQPEAGSACPLTMTHAAIPTLRHEPAIAGQWVSRLTAGEYDPRTLPAAQKTACTMGMGMTEKQGMGVMGGVDAHL